MKMEASVVRGHSKIALGTPHCQVCVVFLGQPVPVVSTGHGYALFCEQCALGRSAPTIRVRDPERLAMRLDYDSSARDASSREEE